ncbi:hypothetical protein SAMN04488032_1327, partial [Pacificibacter marinus]
HYYQYDSAIEVLLAFRPHALGATTVLLFASRARTGSTVEAAAMTSQTEPTLK